VPTGGLHPPVPVKTREQTLSKFHDPVGLLRTVVGSLLAAGLSLVASVSTAANTATDASTNQSVPDLQEIVVTATKSSELMSKVPISMVALSNAALEESGIKSMADIGELVPGVQFDQTTGLGAGTSTTLSIRGINSGIGTSTTGVYLDDIPLQTRVDFLSYWGNPYPAVFDLQRVEVERGPQGTLFGAGAEGGAVRFITTEPSLTDFTAMAHAEGAYTEGGGPSYEGGMALGGPLFKDELGFRFSVWDRHDGGYVDRVNPFNGSTVESNANWGNTLATRIALRFQPSDSVDITPSYFAQVERLNDSAAFYEYLSNPSKDVYNNGRLSRQPSDDRLYVPSLKIEVNLPDGLTLTSVSAYVERWGHTNQDVTSIEATTGAGTPFGGGYGYGVPPGGNKDNYPQYWSFPTNQNQDATETARTDVRTISQEIRLANAADSRAKWTAGAFYSRAVQTDTQNIYGSYMIENVINPYFGLPPFASTDALLASQIRSIDEQLAGFGQLDYKVTPDLVLTLGGRLSHSIADFQQTQSGLFSTTGTDAITVNSGAQSQVPWSGKVGVSYFITPDDMLYTSASRGYRIGGANQPINSAPTPVGCGVQAPATYGGDKVNSYELGIKGKTADHQLHFDVDGYYAQWLNVETALGLACGFGYITNAGTAHSSGFDVALAYDPTSALTLSGAVTYTKVYFVNSVYLPNTTPGAPGSLVVGAGDELAGAGSAPWTSTDSIDYRFQLHGQNLRLHVEDIFKSHDGGTFSWMHPDATFYSTTLTSNPSTNLINGRLNLTLGRCDLALYADNILDSHPTLYRFQDTPQSLLYQALGLRPRTVGLSVDYRL
jgi:iron complex outermembrane recepter protein